MNKIHYILIIVIMSQISLAQEVKFGDISKEELLEKVYTLDTSANAAVLYKYRYTYFDFYDGGAQMITEVQEKIKIYNKRGYEHATVSIGLFKTRTSNEKFSKLKAYTYNLEGDKIIKTALNNDQVFKNERSYNFNEVKFTMPNVQEGSVIEFKYKIISPFYSNIDEFRFQYDIPIKVVEAHIKTPQEYRFKPTHKGFLSFRPKRTTSNGVRSNTVMVKNTYKLYDVPALKEENYVDNINNYRAGVMFELVSLDFPGYFRSFAQTWGDVAQSIGNTDDYEKKLDKSNSFEDQLDELISGTADKIEKMNLVFKYVKDHITWNGIDGKYFQYGIKKALKEKKGNAGDINLTLVAMLRYAGIEANPVVISTKENAVPFFATLNRLNYVIAYAVINDEAYFMDATDEFSDINVMPVKNYNWQGILINNNKMIWKKISLRKPKQAITQSLMNAKLNEDGSVNGTLNSRLSGHYAYHFKKSLKNQDLESFITQREHDFNEIEISDYQTKNTDSYKGNVNESFNFFYEDAAEVLDDKIIIQPLMFLKMDENPFRSNTREYPIDFGYAFKDKFIVNIEIPEGYLAESEIKPIKAVTPNGNAEFLYNISINNNNIRISVNLAINKAIHGPDSYLELKEFFNQIIIKESENIVLKKI